MGASVTKPRDETHLACLVRGDTGAYYRVGSRVDDDLHLGRTPLEGLGEAVDVHAIVGDLDRVVVAHLMRNMISGTHQQSVALISNHQQSSAISGNQLQSVAISGNQFQPMAINGTSTTVAQPNDVLRRAPTEQP